MERNGNLRFNYDSQKAKHYIHAIKEKNGYKPMVTAYNEDGGLMRDIVKEYPDLDSSFYNEHNCLQSTYNKLSSL